ncbi:unnamed protein product [Pleuronectes platessa]|uniref:Uncharacterized protein n=1 Tax=Pleuronectes platessa TaxID=8262 RepID=A0A9N7YK71_PLEPL|nr:unnamed protein product [Pleuronectes platessa]
MVSELGHVQLPQLLQELDASPCADAAFAPSKQRAAKTLFGPSVTEAALSAAQADTFHSLASGFAQSQPCDRSSQPSVAGRHLHRTTLELHGGGRLRAGKNVLDLKAELSLLMSSRDTEKDTQSSERPWMLGK